MNDKKFINTYFDIFKKKALDHNIYNELVLLKNMIIQTNKKKGKVILIGNGGSSAIASHVSVDLNKAARIRSMNFNEYDLITCLSNDYGYENWVSEALKIYAVKDDAVVLTSGSGESPNLVMGAEMAREMGLKVVTFTGREKTNSLSKLSDINFWVNSHAYNIVECIHMIWLTSVIDSIIGSDTYEVS